MARNILTATTNQGGTLSFTLGGSPCTFIRYHGQDYDLTQRQLSIVGIIPWDNSTEDLNYPTDTLYQISGELIERYLQDKLSSQISGVRVAPVDDPTDTTTNVLQPDSTTHIINLSDYIKDIQSNILNLQSENSADSNKSVSAREFWRSHIVSYDFTAQIPSDSENIGVWLNSDVENKDDLNYGTIALRLVNNAGQIYYTAAHPITGVSSKEIVYPTLNFALSNAAGSLVHTTNLNKNSTIYLNYKCDVTLINSERANELTIGGSTLTFRFYSDNQLFSTRVIELPMEETQAKAISTLTMDFGNRTNVTVTGTLETDWTAVDTAESEISTSANSTRTSQLIELLLSWIDSSGNMVTDIKTFGQTNGLNWTSSSPSRISLVITGTQANVSGIVTTLYNLTRHTSKVIGQRINNNTTLTIYKTECDDNSINRFAIISQLGDIVSNYLYIEIPVGTIATPQVCVQYSDSGEDVSAFSSYTYTVPKMHVTQYSAISFDYLTLNAPSTTIPIQFNKPDGEQIVTKDIIESEGITGTVNNVISYADTGSYLVIDPSVYNKQIDLEISSVSGVISTGDPSYEYNAKYKSNKQEDRALWYNSYNNENQSQAGILTNVTYSDVGSGWYPASTTNGEPAYLLLANGSTLVLPGIFGNRAQLGRSIEMLVRFDNCLDTTLDCITATHDGSTVFAVSPDRVKLGYTIVNQGSTTSKFAAAPITYGEWVHIALVMEGEAVNGSKEVTNGDTVFYSKRSTNHNYTPSETYFHVYINGTRSSTKNFTTPGLFNYNENISFVSNSANVQVAFVRVYDSALTSDQVLGLSNTSHGKSSDIVTKIANNNLLESSDAPNINFGTYKSNHSVLLIDGDMQAFNNSLQKKDAIIAKYHALFPGRASYVTADMTTNANGELSLNVNNRFSKNILSLYPEDQIQGTSSRVYPIHNIRWYMKMKSQGKRSSSTNTGSTGTTGYTDEAMTWYPVKKKSKNIYKYPTNCVLTPDSMQYSNGVLTFSYNDITYNSLLGGTASAEVVEFQVGANEFTSTTNSNRKITTDITFTYDNVTYCVVLSRPFICVVQGATDSTVAGEYKKGTAFTLESFGGTACIIGTDGSITLDGETFTNGSSYGVVMLGNSSNSSTSIKVNSGFALTDTGKSKVFCLKADFVDSSQTHNTGTCSAINTMYDDNPDFAPPSHNVKNKHYQSGIEGLPIDVFWVNTNAETPGHLIDSNSASDAYRYWRTDLTKKYYIDNTPNYLGKYMLNQDKKSSGDLFGLYEFDKQEGGLSYYDSGSPNLCVEVGTNRLLWTNWIPMILKGTPSTGELGDVTLYDKTYAGDYTLNEDGWKDTNATLPSGWANGWTVDMVKEYFDSHLVNTHNDVSTPSSPKTASGDGDSSSELCWEVRNYNVPDWTGVTGDELPEENISDYADGETMEDTITNYPTQGHDIAQQWAELCQYIWVCFKTTPGYKYWDSQIMNYNNVLCGFKGWKTDLTSWRTVLLTMPYWTEIDTYTFSHAESGVTTRIAWDTQSGTFVYQNGIYKGEIYWPKSTAELPQGTSGGATKYRIGSTYYETVPATPTKIYNSTEFLNTVSKHFNVKNLCFWYLYTEVFLALDQRTKNCTLATWDVQLRADSTEEAAALNPTNLTSNAENGVQYAHWNYIPYDSDTVLGVNNNGKSLDDEGNFTIPHTTTEQTLDNTGSPNFAGHSNCLWKLVRDTLYGSYGEITVNVGGTTQVPDTLVGAASVLLTNRAKAAWKNKYNCIADTWPDIIYNKDQELKYLLPATEWSYAVTGNSNTFTTPFIDNIQGTARLFRNNLIDKCYSYLYGKYGSEISDMCGINFTKGSSPYAFGAQGTLADSCWVNGSLSSRGTLSSVMYWRGDNSSAETNVFSGVENMSALTFTPNSGEFNFTADVAIKKGTSFSDTALSKLADITFNLTTLTTTGGRNVMDLENKGETKLIGLKNFTIENPTASVTCHWDSISLNTATYLEELVINNKNTLTYITPIKSANLTKLWIPYPTRGITIDSCTSLVFDRNHPDSIKFFGPEGFKFGSATGADIKIINSPGIDIDYFLECFCVIDSEHEKYPQSIYIDNYIGDGQQLDKIRAVINSNPNYSFNKDTSGVVNKDFTITINSFKYLLVFNSYTYTTADSELFTWLRSLSNQEVNIPEYTGIKFTEFIVSGDSMTYVDTMYNITNLDNNTGYGHATAYQPSGHIGLILNQRHRYVGKYQPDTDTEVLLQLDDSDGTAIAGQAANSALDYITGGGGGDTPNYDVWVKEPNYYYKGVNDYQNGVRYIFFSTNDKSGELPTNDGTIPTSIANKGTLYKLEDFTNLTTTSRVLEDMNASTEAALKVENYYINAEVVDAINSGQVVIGQSSSYNILRIDISQFAHILFPAYWNDSSSVCSAITDSDGVVRFIPTHTTAGAARKGYTLYSPFLYHNTNHYKYLYLSVPTSIWGEQSDGGFSDKYLWSYIWMTNSNSPVDWEPFWVFHKESLGAVYEGFRGVNNAGSYVEYSVSGKSPAGNVALGVLQQECYRRGSSNANLGSFHGFSYEQSKDVANLFYAKYGCRNSQWQCGTGIYSSRTTGLVDFLGMRDTVGHKTDADFTANASEQNWYVNYKNDTYTGTSFSNGNGPKIAGYYRSDGTWGGTVNSTNVMGYENFQGSMWEVTGNTWMNLSGQTYYYTMTGPYGGITSGDTPSSAFLEGIAAKTVRRLYNRFYNTSGGTIALMQGGRFADILGVYTKQTAHADSYGDGYYYSTTANRVVGRSDYSGHAGGGVAYGYSSNGSSLVDAAYGCRLAFSGNIVVADNENAFLNA